MGRSRVLAVLALAIVLAGLAVACGGGGSDDGERPRAGAGPQTTAPLAPLGIASDQPCTKQVAADLSDGVRATPFAVWDLERMVLTQEELGAAVASFELDITNRGYLENQEFSELDVKPADTCSQAAAAGRITGFSGAYTSWEPFQWVATAVHLFDGEAEAARWPEEYATRTQAQLGEAACCVSEAAATPVEALPDAVHLEMRGDAGRWSQVWFARGPIVGQVTAFRAAGDAAVDVTATAVALAARIDEVLGTVADRPPPELDVVRLLSAPLPLEAWGPAYADLGWDWWFGGCADNVERAYNADDPEAEAATLERSRRLGGCTAMYSPPDDLQASTTLIRVFSSVTAFGSDEGAGEYLAGYGEGAVETFDPGAIGEEAVGLRRLVAGEGDGGSFVDTRVAFRMGAVLGVVVVHDGSDRDASNEVVEAARRLEQRLEILLR